MPDAFGNISMRITADEVNALLGWRRLIREGPDAFAKAATRAGRSGKRAGKEAESGMAGVVRTTGRAAAAFIGVGSAVGALITFTQILRREIDEIRRRQSTAGSAQVSFGNAFVRARAALGQGGDLTPAELRRGLLSDTSGVGPTQLAIESETALSAGGAGFSKKRAFETVKVAARLRPDLDPDSRRSLVGGAIALQKGFGATPEEAIAGVLQALASARTEELGTFAKNLAGAIASSTAFGNDKDSFKGLASIFIGIGQRSEDPTGRRTATNTIIFMKQLMELMIQRGVVPAGSGFRESLDVLLSGKEGSEAEKLRQELVGVFDKQINELPREFEQIGKAILLGEARQKPALFEILDRSKTSKTWIQILAAEESIVGLNQESVEIEREKVRILRSMPDQQAADNERIWNAALEKLRIQSGTGITGVSSDAMFEVLTRTGQFASEAAAKQFFNRMAAEGRTPSEQVGSQIGFVSGRIKELRREGSGLDPQDFIPLIGALTGAIWGLRAGAFLGGPGLLVGALIGGGIGAIVGDLGERGVRKIPGLSGKDAEDRANLEELESLREQLRAQQERIGGGQSNIGKISFFDVANTLKIDITLKDSDGERLPTAAEVVE